MKAISIRMLVGPVLTSALLAGFTGCAATPSTKQTGAGRAFLDAGLKQHHDRIRRPAIVEINGQSNQKSQAALNPGENTVKIRFNWPQGGSQDVDLAFNARRNQRYYVKFTPHPPTAAFVDSDGLAGDLIYTGPFALLLYPAIVTADQAGKNAKPAHSTHVLVVSEDNSEGVVCNARAYPDGRVEQLSDNLSATDLAP